MERLTVALNGIIVGTLEKTAGGEMSFYYQRDWLERAGSRAISLSMPLREESYRGEIVYNFFDNLLPDSEQIVAGFRRGSMRPRSNLSTC